MPETPDSRTAILDAAERLFSMRGFAATTKLNRKDFGLQWNKALETGGVAVGEDVTVTLDIETTKKAPQQAQK